MQSTHKSAKTNPVQLTRQIWSVFKGWWVGLNCQNNFYSGGRVGCESIDSQIYQIQPDSSIFYIFFKNILYDYIIYSFIYQLS